MIVLDTNVLSEPLKPGPEPTVVEWLDAQHPGTLCITAITVAELRYGLAALPEGRRKAILTKRLEAEVLPLFGSRILPFDDDAAAQYADLQAAARASGRPMPVLDAQIAAIARARGCALATRNVADFEGAGLVLVNPWRG